MIAPFFVEEVYAPGNGGLSTYCLHGVHDLSRFIPVRLDDTWPEPYAGPLRVQYALHSYFAAYPPPIDPAGPHPEFWDETPYLDPQTHQLIELGRIHHHLLSREHRPADAHQIAAFAALMDQIPDAQWADANPFCVLGLGSKRLLGDSRLVVSAAFSPGWQEVPSAPPSPGWRTGRIETSPGKLPSRAQYLTVTPAP